MSDPALIQIGMRGFRGPQGPTGDVTPELEVLHDETLAARDETLAARDEAVTASVAAEDFSAQAVNSAATASAAAIAAQASEDAAELAAAAAAAGSTIYPTEAAGRAAVADGASFWVQGATPSDGLLLYRRTNSTTSVLIGTLPSSGEVTALAARLEVEGPALGFADEDISSLIVSAVLDASTGQMISCECAGFGHVRPSFRATPAGLARTDHVTPPTNVKLTGTTVVVPEARLEPVSGAPINCRARALATPAPAQVHVAAEAHTLVAGTETKLLGQYLVTGSVVVTRVSDSHVLVENTDWFMRNDHRGAIDTVIADEVAGVGTAVLIDYDYAKQRVDIVSAGDDGVYVLTQGTEVDDAPSMWEPSLPAGHRAVWRGLRTRDDLDLAAVHRFRDTIEIGREAEYWAQTAIHSGRVRRTIAAMTRREPVSIFLNSDSTGETGNTNADQDRLTKPNGTRGVIGYFSNYDTATRAKIPQYNYGDAAGGQHIRENYGWGPAMDCLEFYYGKDRSSFTGWGVTQTFTRLQDAVVAGAQLATYSYDYNNGSPILTQTQAGRTPAFFEPATSTFVEAISMHNSSIGGTDSSTADNVEVNDDGSETHGFCMLEARRLNSFIKDVQLALNAGRHCLVILGMGQNEYGSTAIFDHYVTMNGILRQMRSTNPAYTDRRVELMMVMPGGRGPYFRADFALYRTVCASIARAAEACQAALVDTYTLFQRARIGACGMSWREIPDANVVNHEGYHEYKMMAKRAAHILGVASQ